MKAKVYIGAIKYAVYIGRKIVEKTMNFFGFPARFFSTKDGALKDYKMYGKTVQSNLPEGYIQLESLSSTGYEYINTGLVIQSGDEIQLDYEYLGPTPSELSADMMFFGCQNTDTSRGGVWVETYRRTTGVPSWYVRFGSTSSASKNVDDQYITGRHLIVLRDSYFAVDGNLIHQPSNIGTFQTTPLTLFGRLNQTGEQLNGSKIKVFGFKVINNGIVRLNLIPCMNTTGVLGMYDTVTEQFLANAGTGEFIAGGEAQPTPTNPIAIESVGAKTVNLFNKETITKGKYISQAGAVTANASFCYGDYISVVPNTDYIISGTNKGGTAYRRVHGYGADQKWVRQIAALQVQSGTGYTMTFTVPEDCVYIRFSGMSSTNDYEETNIVQIQEGSVVTAYESYGYKIPVNVKSENLFNPTDSRNSYLQSPGVGRPVVWRTSTATTTYIDCHRVEAGKTYTISCMARQLAATSARAGAIIGDDNLMKQVITTPEWIVGKNEYSFVATDDGWLYVAVDINSTDISVRELNETTNIYLDEPLRKLGDYTDYIDFENQKVVRQVGVVNGSTFTWTKGSYDGTGYYTKFNDYTPIPVNTDTKVAAITEISTTYTRNVAYNGGKYLAYACFMSSTGNLILTTRENTTPKCDIYYARITPTEESITLPAIALQQGNLSMDIETKIKPSQLTITGDIDDVR